MAIRGGDADAVGGSLGGGHGIPHATGEAHALGAIGVELGEGPMEADDFCGLECEDEVADGAALGLGPWVGAGGLSGIGAPLAVAIAVEIDVIGVVAGIGDEAVWVCHGDHDDGGADVTGDDALLAKGGDEGDGGFFITMEATDDECDIGGADRGGEVEVRLCDDVAGLD